MTKTIRVCRCPDCGGKFRLPGGEPLPNFCLLCGSDMRVPDPDFVPSRVNIIGAASKSADWVYNKSVADSEARAEAALPHIEAELRASGLSGEEAQRQATKQANEIKVTNMRDNMREGDVAAITPNNVVHQTAEAMKSAVGFDYFQGGASVGGGGKAPFNESGAKSLYAIQGSRSAAPQVGNVAGFNGGFGKAG